VTARDRTILCVVVGLVVLVGSWLLVIQPKRNTASQLETQITAAQQQLQTSQAEVAAAQADERAFKHNYAVVANLGEAVPSDDDTPSLIYQIQNAASHTDVNFLSLALNAASGTPTSSTAVGSSATLPPGASIGPAGFPVMPFTFTFQGNFFHLANFFGRLQQFVVAAERRIQVSGRLMSLNGITLAPAANGFPQITATVSATTYLLPANEGLTDGATSGSPATTSAVSTANTPATSSASVASTP
jgi:hypothetical protein